MSAYDPKRTVLAARGYRGLADGWVEQLSRKLGCRVANYGVSGYGTDQAYVRFQRITQVRPWAEAHG